MYRILDGTRALKFAMWFFCVTFSVWRGINSCSWLVIREKKKNEIKKRKLRDEKKQQVLNHKKYVNKTENKGSFAKKEKNLSTKSR